MDSPPRSLGRRSRVGHPQRLASLSTRLLARQLGIAASGKYDLVVSSLAVDDRNETLRECLKKTGISDIRKWGQLFSGKAHFAVFSHQDWVAWVRAHGSHEEWADWLGYVEARYGIA